MYCNKCGRQLPDNSQFCNFCGAQQSTSSGTQSSGEQQRSGSVVPQKVFVSPIKGGGWTIFSMSIGGNLAISDAGVSYTGSVSSGGNHSYRFDQIKSTSFEMTHVGLTPIFGYIVHLKNGETHKYGYSPLLKSSLQSIDDVIKSKITPN